MILSKFKKKKKKKGNRREISKKIFNFSSSKFLATILQDIKYRATFKRNFLPAHYTTFMHIHENSSFLSEVFALLQTSFCQNEEWFRYWGYIYANYILNFVEFFFSFSFSLEFVSQLRLMNIYIYISTLESDKIS